MDRVLEQILSDLKEIIQLLAESQGTSLAPNKSGSISNTLTVKEAAAYLWA